MMKKPNSIFPGKLIFIFFLLSLFINVSEIYAQNSSITITTSVSNEIHEKFSGTGRIFLFMNQSSGTEPRLNTFPNQSNYIFATNLEDWKADESFTFNASVKLIKSINVSLDSIPNGKYRVQVLWDQDNSESRINAPGNLYSKMIEVNIDRNQNLEIPIQKIIPERELIDNKYLKEVNIKSELLSTFWRKEMHIKAAVLLPKIYFEDPNKKYPVRYNIAGYGGRYTRANNYIKNNSFLSWWESDEAPQIITVFLDGEGPFGDSYQLNSENSGPFGTVLIEELIPFIENEYRGLGTPESRFLDGCSTGGWVSLALQLFYPDYFNGCFSYSPDQVDFENCQLINIYQDDNAFYNEFGYLRPIVRDISGEPVVSQKDFIQFENVLGWSDSYITSGGQFSAFTALFSPKGNDGFPEMLFDPITGKINRKVAEHWKKYDLKNYVEANWEKIGPKINNKVWIWMGDMDHYYLNPALRSFEEMLLKMENPKSKIDIQFSPMAGHCTEYNFREVYSQIETRFSKD